MLKFKFDYLKNLFYFCKLKDVTRHTNVVAVDTREVQVMPVAVFMFLSQHGCSCK